MKIQYCVVRNGHVTDLCDSREEAEAVIAAEEGYWQGDCCNPIIVQRDQLGVFGPIVTMDPLAE
jgi:hypothetical protein